MLASEWNPTIQRGGTFSVALTAEDESGNPRDFSGYDSMIIQVRPPWVGKPGTVKSSPLLTLSSSNGDIDFTSTPNTINVTMTAAETRDLSFNSGKFELEMIIDAATEVPASGDYVAASSDYEAASSDYVAASGDYAAAVNAYLVAGTMTFTADVAGAAGNNFNVTFIDSAETLSATYTVGAIYVTGDFSGASVGIPTHLEIQNAVNALLCGVTVTGGTGAATDLTAPATALANGTDQVGTAQVGTAQVGTAQVGTAAVAAIPNEIVDKLLYGTMYVTGEIVI